MLILGFIFYTSNSFHPSLATVGVLLAVFGYTIGTYGAMLSAELMRIVSP